MSAELQPLEMRIPDELEPRKAWRVFRIVQPHAYKDDHPLKPVWLPHSDRWAVNAWGGFGEWERETSASCKKEGSTHHAPAFDCTCGMWSMKTLQGVWDYFGGHYAQMSTQTSVLAVGEVSIWGRVIEHEIGYRSEKARIDRLWAVYEIPEQNPDLRSMAYLSRRAYAEFPNNLKAILQEVKRTHGCEIGTVIRWESFMEEHSPKSAPHSAQQFETQTHSTFLKAMAEELHKQHMPAPRAKPRIPSWVLGGLIGGVAGESLLFAAQALHII